MSDRPNWWLVVIVAVLTAGAGAGYVAASNWTSVDVGFLATMCVGGFGAIVGWATAPRSSGPITNAQLAAGGNHPSTAPLAPPAAAQSPVSLADAYRAGVSDQFDAEHNQGRYGQAGALGVDPDSPFIRVASP